MGDQAEKLRAIVATTGKADCSVSKEEWGMVEKSYDDQLRAKGGIE